MTRKKEELFNVISINEFIDKFKLPNLVYIKINGTKHSLFGVPVEIAFLKSKEAGEWQLNGINGFNV